MATGARSRRVRRPFIPPEAGGLVEACRADPQHPGDALGAWMRRGRRTLSEALTTAGFSAWDADEACARIVVEAWRRARRGLVVENELGWMSTVAARSRASQRRRHTAERGRLAEYAATRRARVGTACEGGGDFCDELVAAARRLPPPY